MEKIHENMCKQACSYVFIQETYIKAHVLMYFLQLVLTFTPHYIIMVKGLLAVWSECETTLACSPGSCARFTLEIEPGTFLMT